MSLKIWHLVVLAIVIMTGWVFSFRPDVCKENLCNGDRVYVPSENMNGTVVDCCYKAFNVLYDDYVTSPYFPDRKFKLQTKGFNDVVKLSNNPETCVGYFYRRDGCQD